METFASLAKLQEQLDNEVVKTRQNGFKPRSRNKIDIMLSIDDEIQEWSKELPTEYNFKTWKEKTYIREKELVEFTDILFFLLQYYNHTTNSITRAGMEFVFDSWKDGDCYYDVSLKDLVPVLKYNLWDFNLEKVISIWKRIAIVREFSKNEIIKTYKNKWHENIERTNKDWIVGGDKK